MVIDPVARLAVQRGLELQRGGADAGAVIAWFRLAQCAAPNDARIAPLAIAGAPGDQYRLIRRALCLDPAAASLHQSSGTLLSGGGHPQAGETAYRKALAAAPDQCIDAAFSLADRLARGGRNAEAYPLAWWAALNAPRNPGVLVRLATIALASNRRTTAARAFAGAADLLADNLSVTLSAAWAAAGSGDSDAALRLARRALILGPDGAEAAGVLVLHGDDPSWPVRTALLSPGAHATWTRRAERSAAGGDWQPALDDARRAILLAPSDREALRAFIKAAVALARFGLARAAGWRGLCVHPGEPELLYHLSLAERAAGDLGRGWDLEATRDTWPRFHRTLGLPRRLRRDEPPPAGLLIAGEQGLGDELMYLSCLPDLLAECRDPVVEADYRLHPLLARSFPGLRLIARRMHEDAAGIVADYRAVMRDLGPPAFAFVGDLAARYRRRREAAHAGFVAVDPERAAAWRAKIAAIRGDARLVVGISWTSMIQSRIRQSYNSSLEAMAEVLRVPGVRFVNLQYTDCRAETSAFRDRHGIDIWHPEDLDQRDDLDGVAALASTLDLAICAETSVCIIAGAVGCPTIRLGSSIYRTLDDSDVFFSTIQPMIGRAEANAIDLAISRAADALAAKVATGGSAD